METTSFHSRTWIKIQQIPKNLPNDHFVFAIIQKFKKKILIQATTTELMLERKIK